MWLRHMGVAAVAVAAALAHGVLIYSTGEF